MERKYYLRGLGLGIVVTAIIMGIALPAGSKMTDAEVIARAKELGMKEETVLSDTRKNEADAAQEESETPEGEEAEKQTAPVAENNGNNAARQDDRKVNTAEPSETEAPKDNNALDSPAQNMPEDAKEADDESGMSADAGVKPQVPEREESTPIVSKPEETPETSAPTIKTITIVNGDGSYSVAKKLADAGVVTSAENYDSYLCENGYDKKLRTGVFSIPSDASDEQIARIITGRE